MNEKKKSSNNYIFYKFEISSNDDYDASSWSENLTTPSSPFLQQCPKSFRYNGEQLILSIKVQNWRTHSFHIQSISQQKETNKYIIIKIMNKLIQKWSI